MRGAKYRDGVALAIALAAAASCVAQLAATAWATFKHDVRRTSQSGNIGPGTAYLRWACPVGAAMLSSPALGPDGTIYVGAEDGKLYAVAAEGVVKWSYRLSDGSFRYVRSTPSVGTDGTIYVGQWDTHRVYALRDRGDHAELRWQSPDVGAVALSSPALGADGTVYICGCGLTRGLSALDGNDGSLKWRFTTGDSPSAWNQGSPAIGPQGTIYFASEDAHVYALRDAGDHYVLLWSYQVDLPYEQGTSSPAVGADGTVYVGWVGWDQDNFFALRDDGTLKWALAFPDRIMSSPAVAADGTIVVGCDDGKVYALADRSSYGELLWSYQTGSYVESSAALDAAGRLYIGSYDNSLYCLDLHSGALLWSYATGYHLLSSPALGLGRTVYVSGWDGSLYALASPCAGDLDGDGDTDQSDLGMLLADWGCSDGSCTGDADADGDTDQSDLGVLLADWGCAG